MARNQMPPPPMGPPMVSTSAQAAAVNPLHDAVDAKTARREHARAAKAAAPPSPPPVVHASIALDESFFKALGYNRDAYYFLDSRSGQVKSFRARDLRDLGCLLSLAPIDYWQGEFAKGKGDIDKDAVANVLIGVCYKRGFFSTDILRGRGAWWDNDRCVLHVGSHLIVESKRESITSFDSKYIYERGPSFDLKPAEPLGATGCHQFVDLCARLPWERSYMSNILAGWVVCASVCGAMAWRPHIFVAGEAGSGKAQPHSAKVLTQLGWKTMGEIKSGDVVRTPDGDYGRVLRTFPQGVVPIYKITFSDGRETRATADHLWKVRDRYKWRLRTTAEMMAGLAHGGAKARHMAIPIAQPQPLPYRYSKILPLHPYVLGVLLGDGHFGQAKSTGIWGNFTITSADDFIFDRVSSLLPEGTALYPISKTISCKLRDVKKRGRTVAGLVSRLGLRGARSHTKFVPKPYLEMSIDDRFELLRGLMDTDGTVGKRGTLSYCSVSKQLATDVAYLVRSLGGTAYIGERNAWYYSNGERKKGRIAYNVSIRMRDPALAFALPRKKKIAEKPYQYAETFYLGIESIIADGEEESSCILIDHPDRLYITDDFVVTHNTIVQEDIVGKALGSIPLRVSSKTTEPGIRGALGTDARPVVFEEAEGERVEDRQRLQHIYDVARLASSENSPPILKGSRNGSNGNQVDSYMMRSCFCMFGIVPTFTSQADQSRFFVLELIKIRSLSTAQRKLQQTRFEQLVADMSVVMTDEFPSRLIGRAIKNIDVLRHNAKMFSRTATIRFGDARFGDQLGTLLAGRALLDHANRLNPEQAALEMTKYGFPEGITFANETVEDQIELLNTLRQFEVEFLVGNNSRYRRIIGDLLECGAGIIKDDNLAEDHIQKELLKHGIKIMRDDFEPLKSMIWFSNTHSGIKKILKNTKWEANWGRSMRRLPGALASLNVMRFGGGGQTKAVGVPAAILRPDLVPVPVAEPAPEPPSEDNPLD